MEKHLLKKIASIISLFCCLFVCNIASVQAQGEVIPFRILYPTPADPPIIRGNMTVIGNTVIGVNNDFVDRFGNPIPIRRNDEFNFFNNNNGLNRGYIDIDSDPAFNFVFNPALPASERNYGGPITTNGNGTPTNTDLTAADAIGTFSSSSAELLINNISSPAGQSCSTIQRAFLLWSGVYPDESQNPDIPRPNCNGCEHYTDIKILPPNATEYVDIKFVPDNTLPPHLALKSEVIIDGLDGRPYANFGNLNDFVYVCKADITPLLLELESSGQDLEGLWTVANVRGVTGVYPNGSAAGWSMAVVYEDPFETQKNITFFDGYSGIEAFIRGTNPRITSPPTEFTISGFTTIPFGPVNVQLATIALEGDVSFRGDRLQIEDTSGTIRDLSYPGADANNFFDGSVTKPDIRVTPLIRGGVPVVKHPNSSNTLGYDNDHFFLDNSGNSLIANNQTSANFRITTGGDSYYNYFNGFAVDVIAPNLQVVKRVFNQDGTPYVPGTPVVLGQSIRYGITITNIGNDAASAITFVDRIPLNTNFDEVQREIFLDGTLVDPTTIVFSDATVTEDVVDDMGNLVLTRDFTTRQIDFPIPDGSLDIGESVLVEFEVQIVTDCQFLRNACSNRIQNLADVTYSGVINGSDFEIQSAFEINQCGTAPPGVSPFLADQAFCETEAIGITQCTANVTLQAGLGFVAYEWFLDANTNGIGEPGEVVTIDANNNPIASTADNILVNTAGNYLVRQTSSTPCLDIRQRFEVTIFDPNSPPFDPTAALGTKLEECADNGIEITQILLCNGAIDIPTNFPVGTTYLWQVYDETNTSCTGSDTCPFVGANCYIPVPGGAAVSEAASYTLATAGEYRLSVEVPGGCVFDYYFNGVEIEVNPVLELTGGGCKGDVTAVVTGVPTSGATLTYDIFFEILDNAGAVVSRQSSNTTDPTTFTIMRPTPATNVIIRAVVEPNITGFTTNGSCVFETEEEIAEFNTVTLDMPVVTQALCPFDDPITLSFNESRGTISVQATAGSPTYIFNLINRGTRVLVATSNSITDNNFTFTNVIPGVDYDVVVLPEGIIDPADSCADSINVPALLARSEFDGTLNIKPLTCNPAEIEVMLSSTDALDFNAFSYSIVEIPGNTYSGQTSTIFVDDIANQPPPVPDGDPAPPGSTEIINYIDLSTTTTLTIRISDAQGCSINRPFRLEPYDPIQLGIVPNSVINSQCNGVPTGSLQVEASTIGGSALAVPLMYEIISGPLTRPAQTSAVFNNLAPGTDATDVYTIQVTDANGCPATTTQLITEPDAIEATIEVTQPLVCGVPPTLAIINIEDNTPADGTLEFGGTPPYNFSLRIVGGAIVSTTPTIVGTSPITSVTFEGISVDANYEVVISDANPCDPFVTNAAVVEPLQQVDNLRIVSQTPITCNATNGDVNSTVTITADATNGGAIEGYRVSVSSNASVPVAAVTDFSNTTGIFNLPIGSYVIEARTATDNCVDDINVEVIEIDKIALGAPTLQRDIDCLGNNNGAYSIPVSLFATAGYSYTLTRPNGQADLTATGEISTMIDFTALQGGAHVLTVTDDTTGCSATASFTISEPTTAPTFTPTVGNYNCATNTVTVTALDGATPTGVPGGTGGTPGYTYQLDNPATGAIEFPFNTSPAFNNVPAPTVGAIAPISYVLTIRDLNDCETPMDIDVDPQTQLAASITGSDLCFTDLATDPASLDITITSGTAPFTYSINTGTLVTLPTLAGVITAPVLFTIPDLAPNTYNIIVSDASGCQVPLGPVVINEPLSVTSTTAVQPDCTAAGVVPMTGATFSYVVTGGETMMPYTYTVMNMTTGLPVTTVGTGPAYTFDDSFDGQTLEFTATDANGCILVNKPRFTPTYPVAPVITDVTQTVIICAGEAATISIVATGVNALEYSIDGPTGTFQDAPVFANNLASGNTYSIVVRDKTTQCIAEQPFDLVEPAALTPGTPVITQVSCNDMTGVVTLGSLQIPFTGGTLPFTYSLTDSSGAAIPGSPDQVQNVGDPVPTFGNLDIGSYIITVTDFNTCSDSMAERILPVPFAEIINITPVPSDCVGGGVVYFEIRADAVLQIANIRISPLLGITPIDPELNQPGDNINGTIEISRAGNADFPETPPAPIGGGTFDISRTYKFTGLDLNFDGYVILVEDAISSCRTALPIPAIVSPALNITLPADDPMTGACADNGSLEFEFSGPGIIGEDFDIDILNIDTGAPVTATISISAVNNPQSVTTASVLAEGNYRVRVTQTSGGVCNTSAIFTVRRAGLPVLLPPTIAEADCTTTNLSRVTFTATNGVPDYEFAVVDRGVPVTPADFTNMTGVFNLDPVSGLLYDAYVRDSGGCISATVVEFAIEPVIPLPTLTVSPFSPEQCNTTGPYTFTATISNFTTTRAPYTFVVANPDATERRVANTTTDGMNQIIDSNFQLGTYSVVVEDKNGCPSAAETITIFPQLTVTAALADVECDNTIMNITAMVALPTSLPATPVFTIPTGLMYELFENSVSIAGPQATPTFSTGITAGNDYTITVTYNFVGAPAPDCSVTSAPVSRAEKMPPVITPPTLADITCFGSADGSLRINISSAVSDPIDRFDLFFFPTQALAIAAAGNLTTGVAQTASVTDSQLFEGLALGWYVPLITFSGTCTVEGTPVFIDQPTELLPTDFTVVAEQANCDASNGIVNPRIVITVNTTNGTPPYFYRLRPTDDSFTLIQGTGLGITAEIEVNADPLNPIVFTDIQVRDSNPDCPILDLPDVTINPFSKIEVSKSVPTATLSCISTEDLDILVDNPMPSTTYDFELTFTPQPTIVVPIPTPITTILPPVTTGPTVPMMPFTLITENLTAAGTYVYRVTNTTTMCFDEVTHLVREITPIDVTTSPNQIDCFGDTATLSFEVIDFVGAYSYTITDSATALVETGTGDTTTGPNVSTNSFGIGVYNIAVTAGTTGSTLCTVTKSAEITGPEELMLPVPRVVTDLTCLPNSSIEIQVNNATDFTTGGTPPYTYQLELAGTATPIVSFADGNMSGFFDDSLNLGPGTYTVSVRDSNGTTCAAVSQALAPVVAPTPPLLDPIAPIMVSCFGDVANITAVVNNIGLITADPLSLTYALYVVDPAAADRKGARVVAPSANPVFTDISVNTTGYLVEAIDALSCAATTEVMITQPPVVAFNAPELLIPISCEIRTGSAPTAQYRLGATGGNTSFTFERYAAPYDEANPVTPLETMIGSPALFELLPGMNFFRVVDGNGCDDVLEIDVAPEPTPIMYEIEFTENRLCAGEAGGFVDIRSGTFVTGGVGDYRYNVYLASAPTTPLVAPAVNMLSDSGFAGLLPGDYIYEVTSGTFPMGGCTPVRMPFSIQEFPELTLDTMEAIAVACAGDTNGIFRVKVTTGSSAAAAGLGGPYVYNVFRENEVNEASRFITEQTDTEVAQFEDLAPGIYTYTVIDNGTGCPGPTGTFEIEDKDQLMIVMETRSGGLCASDTDATITYRITGGTPPYYFQLVDLTAGELAPDLPTENPDGISGDLTKIVTFDAGSTELFTIPPTFTLVTNNDYQLYIADSGNGLMDADLIACNASVPFTFTTPDLEGFSFIQDFVCPTESNPIGSYTVTVRDVAITLVEPETRLSYVLTDTDTGIVFARQLNNNIFENVPSGNYEITLEYQQPAPLPLGSPLPSVCSTSVPLPVLLDPYTPLQFPMDLSGNMVPVQEIGLNSYRIIAAGGVTPYRYVVRFLGATADSSINLDDPKDQGDEVIVETDLRGRGEFEVEDSGLYNIIVIDGNGCEISDTAIGIDFIDLIVPNVFNPASGDPNVNRWYPDNLFSDTDSEFVPSIGAETTPDGTIIFSVTTGGTTTGDETTGGTTTITTITPDGISTVRVITTGTIIGGTVIGGTTTDGVTTGGYVTGGLILGGTSTGVINPNSITTGGQITTTTTTGGTTTGGTTTGGVTTRTETENGTTTINVFIGGTVTGGTITDGILTGGVPPNNSTATIPPTEIDHTGDSPIFGDAFIDFAQMEVMVFDRYGRLLAKFRGIKDRKNGEGWDGIYDNNNMPTGDYWYLIKLNDPAGREFTGHFTLYRKNN